MKILVLVFFSGVFSAPILMPKEGGRTCDGPAKALPFCDISLTIDERVQDLISRLDLDEKLGQFANDALEVSSLGISKYQWWSEALHGVGNSPGVDFDKGPVHCATSFPQVINTGSTFDSKLMSEIGSAVGTEARAMNNLHQAGLTFWAPNINIFRDPRWGRGQETPGEDPTLNGIYATEFVRGMQEGEDKGHVKVSSCCKHFYDYNLENSDGVDRFHFDAITTQQDIADTYLPAFEACVRDGHASSLMCSYNSATLIPPMKIRQSHRINPQVNGIPSCANSELMTTIARGAWAFDGYITSDCDAVGDVYYSHHYTESPEATCNATLAAGMDVDCGQFLHTNLKGAIDKSLVSLVVVDRALSHLFRVRFRLGEFDPVETQPYLKYDARFINSAAHRQLALDAARESIVLLKNIDASLPLNGNPTVALVGPNSNDTALLLGNYFGQACNTETIGEALAKFSDSVSVARGCDVACKNESGFAEAVGAAARSDISIVVVGLDQAQESEGLDRLDLLLPGKQSDLIDAVAAVAKKMIVVILSGGPVDVSHLKIDDRIHALLWGGYPGQFGAQALAETIFGVNNPSGRLTMTWYPQQFVSEAKMTDVNMRPDAATKYPGRTYRFYTGEPVFKFGEGMSYTTFAYSAEPGKSEVSSKLIAAYVSAAKHVYLRRSPVDTTIRTLSVTVTNTGRAKGATSVLVFANPPRGAVADLGAPKTQLITFGRVTLEPGQAETLQFNITAHDLTVVDSEGARVGVNGDWMLQIGNDGPTTTLTVE